jgi:two-component system response regulator QseB
MRILLAEDDKMIGKAIKEAISCDGDIVDLVEDGISCETAILTTNFDALILDINLPEKNGIEVLKSIRAQGNKIPILILTAYDKTSQKVEGLNFGADDYLTKPFDIEELIARLNSLVRRSKGIATSSIKYKNIEINPLSHQVFLNENLVEVSNKEFKVLQILLENINKVISKKLLEESLYSWDDFIESNTIEVHIHHLRKKFGQNLIKTIRGIGYIIEKE